MCSCLSVSFLYPAPVDNNSQTSLRYLSADGIFLKNAYFYPRLCIVGSGQKDTKHFFEKKKSQKPSG